MAETTITAAREARVLLYAQLDPARLERAIQALMTRLHPKMISVDGAGGDDGRDMHRTGGSGLELYEVKSFTARLTPGQRRQVQRSLSRVAEHEPASWTLVVPLNPSPAEERWFAQLGAAFPTIELRWWGQSWLDGHFAAHLDLVSFVEGADAQVLARAAQFSQETAVLAGGLTDLAARSSALGRLGDEISPFWRYKLTVDGESVTQELVPKHSDAATLDPISIHTGLSFPRDDAAAERVMAQLREAIDVGGDVTVPAEYVTRFDVQASSDATARLLGTERPLPANLTFTSLPSSEGLPMLVELELLDRDEAVVSVLPLTLTDHLGGLRGMTLRGVDASQIVEFSLVLRDDPSDPGRLQMTFRSVRGRLPHEVLPALRFLQRAELGNKLRLRSGPTVFGSTHTASSLDARPSDELIEFVEDLETIATKTGTLLRIPDLRDGTDVRDVHTAAELLRGHRVPLLGDVFTLTLRPGGVDGFLAKVPEEGGQLLLVCDYLVTVGGQQVNIGRWSLHGPAMTLVNRDELQMAAPSLEIQAQFRCFPGTGMTWGPAPAGA